MKEDVHNAPQTITGILDGRDRDRERMTYKHNIVSFRRHLRYTYHETVRTSEMKLKQNSFKTV